MTTSSRKSETASKSATTPLVAVITAVAAILCVYGLIRVFGLMIDADTVRSPEGVEGILMSLCIPALAAGIFFFVRMKKQGLSGESVYDVLSLLSFLLSLLIADVMQYLILYFRLPQKSDADMALTVVAGVIFSAIFAFDLVLLLKRVFRPAAQKREHRLTVALYAVTQTAIVLALLFLLLKGFFYLG